jgi:hypothetical protein
MLDIFENLGTFEQGFGGNTAPVEAYSTQRFALNHGRFEAQLRGADGSDIPAGSTAKNNNIVIHEMKGFWERQDTALSKDAQTPHQTGIQIFFGINLGSF